MKRRDILDATKLLTRHKIDINQATLMVGTSYIEGRRDGSIEKSFDDWLDEDIDDWLDEDIDEDELDLEDELDPTPEATGPKSLSTTKWPSSATPSQDSAPVATGT